MKITEILSYSLYGIIVIMYKFSSGLKLIPFVLFILMLVATTRQATINNCIQSKQEVENGKPYIRCIQCIDGYYVKSGTCLPCVYNKIIPVPKNVQCNIMKSFSFGSNIGGIPDPKYNIKNTANSTSNLLNTTTIINISKPTNTSTVVVMNAIKSQDKIVMENKTLGQEISNSSKSNVNLTAPLQKNNALNVTLNNQKNTSHVLNPLIASTIKTIAVAPAAPIASVVPPNSLTLINQPAPVASVIQTNLLTGPSTSPVISSPTLQKNQSTNPTVAQKSVQSAPASTNITNSSLISSSKSTPTPTPHPTQQNPILSIASQTNSLNQLSAPLSQMLQNCRQLSSDNNCIKCFVGFTVNAGACVKNQISLSKQNQKGCAVYDQVKNKCLMCDDEFVLNQVGICQSNQQNSNSTAGPGNSKDTGNTSSTNNIQKIDNRSPNSSKIEAVPAKPQPIFSKSDNQQLSDKKTSKQPIPPLLNKSKLQQINLHSKHQPQTLPLSQNSQRIFPKLSQNLKIKLQTKPFDLPIFKANNINSGKYQNQKLEPTLKVLLNIQDANSPNQSYIIQANTDNCAEYINQSNKNKGENKDVQICARCMKDFIWNDILKRCIQVSRPLQLLKSPETIQKQEKKVEEKQINKLQKSNQSVNVNVNNTSAVVQQSSPSTTITITVNTASPNNTIISITNNPTLKDNTSNTSNISSTSNASTAEVKAQKQVNKNTTSGGGAILLSKSQSNFLSSNTLNTDEQGKGNLTLPNSFGTNISNLPNLQPNLILNSSNLTKQSPSQPMPAQANQTAQSLSATNNRIPKCIQYKNTSPQALTCKQCETGYKLYQNKCLEPSAYIQALKEAALQRIAVIQNNG